MIGRAPAWLLVLAVVGGGPPSDPVVVALEGGDAAPRVAAPSGDPDLDAVSWAARPRREIVDDLAALRLRGEDRRGPPAALPSLPPPPSRVPEGFDPPDLPVTDRLAWWVPADAAAVFLPGLREGQEMVDRLAGSLPVVLPGLAGDPPGGTRDALRRALQRLLLPTIWRSNPGVRTGTRQVVLVVADPDLRGAPGIALLCEVDDAGLLLAQRRASFRWEERYASRLRVDGLDATTDDGAVRSFFALEGGTAVFSTSRSLRDRILAAGAGRAPSLLRPDRRAWALSRSAFPAAEGGALLVIPDGFLARVSSADTRLRRAEALRCEAARLLLDARSLRGEKVLLDEGEVLCCDSGGELWPKAGTAGCLCTLHGTAAAPVPLGDLRDPSPRAADEEALGRLHPVHDPILAGGLPVAARYRATGDGPGELEVLVPLGEPGFALMEGLRRWVRRPREEDEAHGRRTAARRAEAIGKVLRGRLDPAAVLEALTGLGPPAEARAPSRDELPTTADDFRELPRLSLDEDGPAVPEDRWEGGVLRIPLDRKLVAKPLHGKGLEDGVSFEPPSMEWR